CGVISTKIIESYFINKTFNSINMITF
ncbi:hypothetical protein EAI_03087, partial [Harpegnathos saltator]